MAINTNGGAIARRHWFVPVFLVVQGCYPLGSSIGTFHLKPSEKCWTTPLNLRPLGVRERSALSHALFVNGEGKALEPHVGRCATEFADADAFGRYLRVILDSIRAEPDRKVLLRIHGGLNTLSGSLAATVKMTKQIEEDRAAGYYPVFVNWESGLLSAYGEHAFLLFRGRRLDGLKGFGRALVGGPFFLAADIGTGLVRYPITQATQLLHIDGAWNRNNMPELLPPSQVLAGKTIGVKSDQVDSTGASSTRLPKLARAESSVFQAYAQGLRRDSTRGLPPPMVQGGVLSHPGHSDQVAISRFGYHRTRRRMAFDVIPGVAFAVIPLRYWVMKPSRSKRSFNESYHAASSTWRRVGEVISWMPPKAITLSLVSGFGAPAWESMRRRTDLMIRPLDNYTNPSGMQAGAARPSGALAQFLDSLAPIGPRHPITIVGHSMGAIVATQILRLKDSLPVDHIVFLASAASMRETNDAVTPFLRSHPRADFYSVTLHPLADQRESLPWYGLKLSPNGSLLAWIDAYFGRIETPADRMSGVYANLVDANGVFPDGVRGRMHFKAFGYGSGTGCGSSRNLPFKHGQFNDPAVPFWRQAFWTPGPMPCAEVFPKTLVKGQ